MKKTFTKTIVTLIICSFCTLHSFAQKQGSSTADEGKNLVKINLASLALKTVSVQYERAIHKKISVGMGVRFMPKGSLPFSSSFDSVDDQLGSLELGNVAITPEIKFYMGKGVFKGFYVAPFLRYANYNAAINYEFESGNTTETMPLSGNLNTFTGGVLLGAQWRIANKVYFDWSIFGPQYGFSSGELAGVKTLNAQEQQSLREELNGIDLPVGKIESTVTANGAKLKFDGPWAGIRANIGIGYRF